MKNRWIMKWTVKGRGKCTWYTLAHIRRSVSLVMVCFDEFHSWWSDVEHQAVDSDRANHKIWKTSPFLKHWLESMFGSSWTWGEFNKPSTFYKILWSYSCKTDKKHYWCFYFLFFYQQLRQQNLLNQNK